MNARISDRSLPGYLRWKGMLRRVLRNVDLFLAQTSEDARRLVEIGAEAERVLVGGNLKYDLPPPAVPPIADRLRSALSAAGTRQVLVCGSTVEAIPRRGKHAEDGHQWGVVARLDQRHLLARHLQELREAVAAILQQAKLRFFRRSRWNGESLSGSVLLIDSIGELSSLYALADVAFVGGSLVPRGGHNILEPAQHGVPILVGPHTENFRDIVDLFRDRDAVRVVAPSDLASAFLDLLANENPRQELGRRAADTLDGQRGAYKGLCTSQRVAARNRRGKACVNRSHNLWIRSTSSELLVRPRQARDSQIVGAGN